MTGTPRHTNALPLTLFIVGTIPDNVKNEMYLDKLQVEKERGITVKAQTCTILYPHTDGVTYMINLIDTPVRFYFSLLFASCFN